MPARETPATGSDTKAIPRGRAPERSEPAYFGLLLTTHPPAEAVNLVVADKQDEGQAFQCVPFFTPPGGGAMLALLYPKRPAKLDFRTFQVMRGRVGHKQPEVLQVLEAVPLSLSQSPRVRIRGLAKAAGRALEQFTPPGALPGVFHWWLALQFALSGALPTEKLRKAAAKFGSPSSPQELPGSIVKVGKLAIWTEHLVRRTEELERYLQAMKRRNPCLDHVDRQMVQRWLAIPEAELAGRVLLAFSKKHGMAQHRNLFGRYFELSRQFIPEPMRENEGKLAERILKSVATGETLTMQELARAFPSHLHVINWLIEAGHLLEGQPGYYFTQKALLRDLDKLRKRTRDLRSCGVRDIKDCLGYHRRQAEALRALLIKRYGQPVTAPIEDGGEEA